jgi:putrescine transport system substrate-binding protein
MGTRMTGRLSRRQFLARAGTAGAVVAIAPLLNACTTSSKQLTFQNWTNYIDPDLLPGFSSATGIGVSYETYVSNDELASRLALANAARRRGRVVHSFDLIVPSDNFVRQFQEQGLLQPIDGATNLSNIGNLAPEFRAEGFDPQNRYTIPWATGTTGIGYDTSVFSTPPDYSVFLDTRYQGKMTMLDEERDAYGAALFSLGKDPNTTSSADIDAATNQLIKMKAVIKDFDSSTYIDGLGSGQLVAAHAYNGDLLQAKERNPNLDFVLPEAGALRWVDSLAVPTDAPDLDNALIFMNYYLQADVSAKNSDFIQYDTANQAAFAKLDPSVKNNPVIFPSAQELKRLQFTVDLGDAERLYADGWKKVMKA